MASSASGKGKSHASGLSPSPRPRNLETERVNVVDEQEKEIQSESETQIFTSRVVDATAALQPTHATVLPPVSMFQSAQEPAVHHEITVEEEYDLLQENHLIPPDSRQPSAHSPRPILSWIRHHLGLERTSNSKNDPLSQAEIAEASENSPLLSHGQRSVDHGQPGLSVTSTTWEGAVAAGKVQTTWKRETKVLATYSMPLIVTFLLQHSLTMVSIVTVGHLGQLELGAASLASMTAVITGYTFYYGLATSLDTLSPQAYGSNLKGLVGIQLQRMTYFLWLVTIPIALLWYYSAPLLRKIIPDPEVANLAGLYLKILIFSAPASAAFESGKRFVQAQGLFNASLGVLLICAPLNAFLHWFFVWRLGWGFIGTPIAVSVTYNVLPLMLFLYVYFINGRECWPGFSYRALKNWGPMIRLAIPGLIMFEAEYMAFEILTLAASYLSTGHLGAQAVLANLTTLSYRIPSALAIAGSTRIANLIGANLPKAARTSTIITLSAACLTGAINVILFYTLRYQLPKLFTHDAEVIHLAVQALPLCAAFQLNDSVGTVLSGVLRGLGRQSIGGWANLLSYYLVGLPLSFYTAFVLEWKLIGLWAGVAIGLTVVTVVELWFVYRTDWDRAVKEAKERNSMG
ncbi:MAG: hypothetical protein M1816_005729 [Peltula sp. TS41687]|nr:MAG: hypothetical protein M1816_005729 [Peltula sp. TS41687]